MKIAVITDTHYGIRNDSAVFYDYQKKGNDQFFDYIDKNDIKQVLHLGDLYDRRKYINYVTAKRCHEDFLSKFGGVFGGLTMDIITGNHDIYYKNTSSVNALDALISGHGYNITAYTSPITKEYDGLNILLMPWISSDEVDSAMHAIRKSPATVLFGHLELNGFEMHKGQKSDHGMEASVLDRFQLVASGHFHHKSTVGNINYLGAAYEFTWSDHNDPRGFHIFDTNTLELEFIQNPHKMFHMIPYDDSFPEAVQLDIKERDFAELTNCYVKVVAFKKSNPYLFDMFIDKIYKASPQDITIVEDSTLFNDTTEDEIVNESEDTMTILNKYIDGLQMDADGQKIKDLMKNIYVEAITMEETINA